MDRREELWQKAQDITDSYYQSDVARIQAEYAAQQEAMQREFSQVLDGLFAVAVKAQEAKQKQAVKYLVINYLRSSFYTKTYQYHIALYDEQLYVDRHCIGLYWCPKFIFCRVDEIIQEAAPKLRKKMIRLRDHEIEEYRMMYLGNYLQAAAQFFAETVQNIEMLPQFQLLKKTESFYVLYGEYMGMSMKLKTIEAKEAAE